MNDLGDLVTTVLAREFVAAAADGGIRIIAVTTTSSLVAALAAQHLGADQLAVAPGFGTLDAAPRPTVSLGEAALRTASSARGPISDTFIAVARGFVGVVVAPAQLDASGATNLSHIGGTHRRPTVALPGSRGLPDNNDSPSRVWYLVPDHSPRTLVDRVDFVSGPPPAPGRIRRLITRMGIFQLDAEAGWRAQALFPGIEIPALEAADTFPVDVPDDTGTIDPPSSREIEVLAAVDPAGLRSLEFAGKAGRERSAAIIAWERAPRGTS